MKKKSSPFANKFILIFLGIVLIVLTLQEMAQTAAGRFWLVVLGALAFFVVYLLKIRPDRQMAAERVDGATPR